MKDMTPARGGDERPEKTFHDERIYLKDLDISEPQSHRWQTIAEMPEELERILRPEAKERQIEGGKEKLVQKSAQPKTRQQVAQTLSTSHDTPPFPRSPLACGRRAIKQRFAPASKK